MSSLLSTALVWFLAAPLPLLGQSPQAAADATVVTELATEPVLESLKKRYGSGGGIEARFTEQAKSDLWGDGPTRKVLVEAMPDGRFRWEYLEQNGELYVADRTTFWLVQPGTKVASKSAYDPAITKRMLGFLTGISDLGKDFDVVRKPDDGALRVLELEAKKPSEIGTRAITMKVAADGSLREVTLVDESGTVTRLSMESVEGGKTIKDERFKYTPPPGFSVMTL